MHNKKVLISLYFLWASTLGSSAFALDCMQGPGGNLPSTWYITKENERILLASLKDPKSIIIRRADLKPGTNTNNYGTYIIVDGQPINGPDQPSLHHLGSHLSEAKSIELLSSSTLNLGDSIAGAHSFLDGVDWNKYTGLPWVFEAGGNGGLHRSAPVFKGVENRHIRICVNNIMPHPTPVGSAKVRIYTDTGYLRMPSVTQGDGIARFTLFSCVDLEAKQVNISADNPASLKQRYTFEGCAYIQRK